MNAQKTSRELWAYWFADWRDPFATKYQRKVARNRMRKVRREAALERLIAAQQRTIEAQAQELNNYHRLQSDIDMGVIVLEMPASDD